MLLYIVEKKVKFWVEDIQKMMKSVKKLSRTGKKIYREILTAETAFEDRISTKIIRNPHKGVEVDEKHGGKENEEEKGGEMQTKKDTEVEEKKDPNL